MAEGPCWRESFLYLELPDALGIWSFMPSCYASLMVISFPDLGLPDGSLAFTLALN